MREARHDKAKAGGAPAFAYERKPVLVIRGRDVLLAFYSKVPRSGWIGATPT